MEGSLKGASLAGMVVELATEVGVCGVEGGELVGLLGGGVAVVG